MNKKKPWSTPELRRIPITDEILELFARTSTEERPMPVKNVK